MKEIILKYKELFILVLIGIGFTPFFLIREIITPATMEHYDNLPYEYSQTGEEGYLCVFPPAIYTNYRLIWYFECSDENDHILMAVVHIGDYYHYEKLAYHRENGNIISHEGNWLLYFKHYVLSNGKSSDEGIWNPPSLTWWCLVFYDIDTNQPLPAVTGVYSYGSGGIRTVINVELAMIISGSYGLCIILLYYFLNKKYDFKTQFNERIQ